jgi:hypothetical protein
MRWESWVSALFHFISFHGNPPFLGGIETTFNKPCLKKAKVSKFKPYMGALKQTTDCTSMLELYLWKADDGNRWTWTRPHCSLVFCEKPGFTPVHKVYLEPLYRAYGFLCCLLYSREGSSLNPLSRFNSFIMLLAHVMIITCHLHQPLIPGSQNWVSLSTF